MQELHLAMPIMSFTSAIASGMMGLNYLMYRSVAGVKQWLWSMLLMTLSSALLIGIATQPVIITFVALLCLYGSFYFFVFGTKLFFKQYHNPLPWLIGAIIFVLVTFWFSFIEPSRAMRFVASFLLVTTSMGLAMRTLFVCPPSTSQRTNLSRWGFLAACVWIFIVLSTHLLWLDMNQGNPSLAALDVIQVVLIAATVCIPILLCVAFSLLCGAQQLEKLAVLMKSTKQASLLKGRYLTMLSHELRTPLNAIVGHADMLKSAPHEPQKHTQYCDVIIGAANSLSDLANQVLLQAKGEQVDNQKVVIDLFEECQSSVDLLMPLAMKKGLIVNIHIDEAIKNNGYKIDKDSLLLVIKNLLSNAIKYTNAGHIDLYVNHLACATDDSQHSIEFLVQDTGVGMDQDALDYIFEPFKSAHYQQSISSSAGFGLCLCKQLVENLGGHLQVKSKLDEGTTFSFTLNLTHCAAPKSKLQPVTNQPELLSGNAAKTVLIVEDNQLNQEVLKHYLAELSLTTFYVGSLLEASNILHSQPIDIVLLDMHLPDGHGLSWWIEQQHQLPPAGTPTVIALTGDADEQAQQAYLQHGITYCLEKPISAQTLHTVLDQVCNAHNTPLVDLHLFDEGVIEQLNQQYDPQFINTKLMYLADTFDYEFAQLQGLADIHAIDKLESKLRTLSGECLQLGMQALAQALEETLQAVLRQQLIDWKALHLFARQNAQALQNYQNSRQVS